MAIIRTVYSYGYISSYSQATAILLAVRHYILAIAKGIEGTKRNILVMYKHAWSTVYNFVT